MEQFIQEDLLDIKELAKNRMPIKVLKLFIFGIDKNLFLTRILVILKLKEKDSVVYFNQFVLVTFQKQYAVPQKLLRFKNIQLKRMKFPNMLNQHDFVFLFLIEKFKFQLDEQLNSQQTVQQLLLKTRKTNKEQQRDKQSEFNNDACSEFSSGLDEIKSQLSENQIQNQIEFANLKNENTDLKRKFSALENQNQELLKSFQDLKEQMAYQAEQSKKRSIEKNQKIEEQQNQIKLEQQDKAEQVKIKSTEKNKLLDEEQKNQNQRLNIYNQTIQFFINYMPESYNTVRERMHNYQNENVKQTHFDNINNVLQFVKKYYNQKNQTPTKNRLATPTTTPNKKIKIE